MKSYFHYYMTANSVNLKSLKNFIFRLHLCLATSTTASPLTRTTWCAVLSTTSTTARAMQQPQVSTKTTITRFVTPARETFWTLWIIGGRSFAGLNRIRFWLLPGPGWVSYYQCVLVILHVLGSTFPQQVNVIKIE